MSIIHDALKKVQEKSGPKADTTQSPPALTEPPKFESVFSDPPPRNPDDVLPAIEHLPAKENKARSILAFLAAIAITIGSFVFCYAQLHTYFPKADRWVTEQFDQLVHKNKHPEAGPQTPKVLTPLAKITVLPPSPAQPASPVAVTKPLNPTSPGNAPNPASLPAVSNTNPPTTPQTLNIHGVMSNGTSNLVLINDQVYQEGDEVDGIKILKINLNTITVLNNGQEEKIRVKS